MTNISIYVVSLCYYYMCYVCDWMYVHLEHAIFVLPGI